MRVITVSAICFERDDGLVLTVRKRGTFAWMLPGGKPETGETAAACAVREAREELGVRIAPADLALMGAFDSRAANEAGFELRAHVFRTRTAIAPVPRAEIEALRWVDPAVAIGEDAQAPLNRELVFPLLTAATREARAGADATNADAGCARDADARNAHARSAEARSAEARDADCGVRMRG